MHGLIFISHKIPRAVIPLLLALCAVVARADDTPAAPDEKAAIELYKKHTSNGVTFTYPANEQELVDEITQAFPSPIRLIDDASFETQLALWKKHDLALIAKCLALEKSTDAMNAGFEQFRDLCQPIISQEIREVRIYYFADLKEALARGLSIDGISYVPETDSLNIANHITADGPDGKKNRVLPLVLMQKNPVTTEEKMRFFNGTLRDMRWRLDEAIYNTYCGRLYEIARRDITACVSNGRSPLWLIDGMTNALSLVVMRSHNPAFTFGQILQKNSTPPPNFAKYAAAINLDSWVISRTAATTKEESDSYFYLAMLAAAEAIEQTGENWLPVFFTRLRAENTSTLNMGVLYALYNKLTNADLRDAIARVKERIAGQTQK